jgi:hypothetical protein
MPALKGRYKVKNRSKYKGDLDNVIYRSSWELKDHVLQWSSEHTIIPYKHPITGKTHRYFPDFKVKLKTKSGIETWIVEIKPYAQTKEPVKKKRMTKRYLNEVTTYAINAYKWKAAEDYCKRNGYRFVILTEKELAIES